MANEQTEQKNLAQQIWEINFLGGHSSAIKNGNIDKAAMQHEKLLIEIALEMRGIQHRAQECSKKNLCALVETLSDGMSVPAELVKEIVSCLITPERQGIKKNTAANREKAQIVAVIGALAKAKGRGYGTKAIKAISLLWCGKHAGDQSKEIKAALKKEFSKDNEPHLEYEALRELSEDEIKKISFPESPAEYKKLKDIIFKKMGL